MLHGGKAAASRGRERVLHICEAQYAHGKADFISKLRIALKEANETGYWLELLVETDYRKKKLRHSIKNAPHSVLCSSPPSTPQNKICNKNKP